MLSGASEHAEQRRERVRRRGERARRGRACGPGRSPAPDERVERVVVDEPAADEQPRAPPRARRCRGEAPCGAMPAERAPQPRGSVGERAQQLARGALAELEALEPVGLVRRVDVVLGQAEPADDHREAALGQLGDDRDRAAGAHERGASCRSRARSPRRRGGSPAAPASNSGGPRRESQAISSSAPSGRRVAQQARRARRASRSGSWPRRQAHRQVGPRPRRDDRPRRPALEPVDVERRRRRRCARGTPRRRRGCSRARADLVERIARRRAARSQDSSSAADDGRDALRAAPRARTPSGPGSTCAERAGAARARVQRRCRRTCPSAGRAAARSRSSVARDDAAQADGDRRRCGRPPSRSRRRSRVGAALVGGAPSAAIDSPPASSSPSTSTRTWTGSSPARASAHAACSSGRKLPLSSAAPRA